MEWALVITFIVSNTTASLQNNIYLHNKTKIYFNTKSECMEIKEKFSILNNNDNIKFVCVHNPKGGK